ncbi:hypothetical protein E2C01_057817 [Portunus trituberculatus]|uniref:Uncharacterized protein n=1 Tax=Portunus trituberculatus TaxID=210409 RepID=A0A5B7H253_PORTR|nr:hypothetical protein [Portunus trituberculatus]
MVCKQLKKRRHENEEAESDYQNAWTAYVRQQRVTKRKNSKRGEGMPNFENVESLKMNGSVVAGKEEMGKVIKECWEEIGCVIEVLDVREKCAILERKNVNELNERISREQVEKCVTRQKNGKVALPDEIPYEVYKNRKVVIGRMTEVFNHVGMGRRERAKSVE